jgi:Matrixin/Glucodextranase, domain B
LRILLMAGAVCLLLPSVWPQSTIRLKVRTIDPALARPGRLSRHYLIQFRSYPGPVDRAELERRGIRVLGYVPDRAVMASSPTAPDLEGLDIQWTGSLAASDKLSPELATARPGAYLLMLHEDVPPAMGRRIVRRQGFQILERPGLLPGHLLILGAAQNLADLAVNDEVAYILPASGDLLALQNVVGCAGALTEAGPVGQYVEVGRGWAPAADGMVRLKYVFESLTSKIEENALRNEIGRALSEWARYAELTFSPGDDPRAARTIAIEFARRAHGDGYPFDGPGGILAHTFYPAPPNSEPIAGDMHLDAEESWRIGADVDMFSVALHEAGHALGLGHSDKPGTVMYPYYHRLTGLGPDDIAGIRDLYGGGTPGAGPPPPQPPAQPPTQPQPQPPVQPPTPPPASPDRTPPSLRVASPGSSIVSTFAASIPFSGTAVDDVGVTVVRWFTSNGSSGTASGTGSWSAEVPLLVGNNVVTIRAYDGAGNSGWRAVTVVRR